MPTVLDQQPRNGSFDSGSLAVPGGTNPDTGEPYTFFLVSCPMSDADASDPGSQCALGVMVSWDGQTYADYPPQLEWVGGELDRNGNPKKPSTNPSIPRDQNGNPPVRVMARLDTRGNTLNTGIAIGFR